VYTVDEEMAMLVWTGRTCRDVQVSQSGKSQGVRKSQGNREDHPDNAG